MKKSVFLPFNHAQSFQVSFRTLISTSVQYFTEATFNEINYLIDNSLITHKQSCTLFAHAAKYAKRPCHNKVSQETIQDFRFRLVCYTESLVEESDMGDIINILSAHLDLKIAPDFQYFTKLKCFLNQNTDSIDKSNLSIILRFFSTFYARLDYELETKLINKLYQHIDNAEYSFLANSLRALAILGTNLAPELRQKYLDNMSIKIHKSMYHDLSSSLWAIIKLDIPIDKNLEMKFVDEIHKNIKSFAPRQLCSILSCFVKMNIDVSEDFSSNLQLKFLRKMESLNLRELNDIVFYCAKLNMNFRADFKASLKIALYQNAHQLTIQNFANIVFMIAGKNFINPEGHFLELHYLQTLCANFAKIINDYSGPKIQWPIISKLISADFIFLKMTGYSLFDSKTRGVINSLVDEDYQESSETILNFFFEKLQNLYGDNIIKHYIMKECGATADIFFEQEKCVIQIDIPEGINYNGNNIFNTKLKNAILKAAGYTVVIIDPKMIEQNLSDSISYVKSQIQVCKESIQQTDKQDINEANSDKCLFLGSLSESSVPVKDELDSLQISPLTTSEDDGAYLPETWQNLDYLDSSNYRVSNDALICYYTPCNIVSYDQYINYINNYTTNTNTYSAHNILMSNVQNYNTYYYNLYLQNIITYNDYSHNMNIYYTAINNSFGYNLFNLLPASSFILDEVSSPNDII